MGAYTPVSIPLGPLNTKHDDSVLPLPQVAEAKNLRVKRTGGYARRPGYAALSALDLAGNTVMGGATTTVEALAAYRDSMVAFTNAQKLYEYSSTAARWIDKGSAAVTRVDVTGVGGPGDATPLCVDVAVTSTGYTVYAITETVPAAGGSTDRVSFAIFDGDGTLVGRRNGLESTAGGSPAVRVVAVGAMAVIVWATGANNIRAFTVNCTSAATMNTSLTSGTFTAVSGTSVGRLGFDIVARATDVFIGYIPLAAGEVSWGFLSTAEPPVLSGTSTFATGRTPALISVAVESGLAAHAITYTDGTSPSDVYVLHRSWNGSAWSVTSTSGALDTTLTTAPGVGLASRFDTATVLRVWYSCAETNNMVTYQSTCTTGAFVVSRVVTLNHTWIASKPFAVGTTLYFWGWQCGTESPTQPYTTANPAMYLFESATGLPVGQALPGTAVMNILGNVGIPQVATSGTTYRTAFLEQTRAYASGGSIDGGQAMRIVDASFDDRESLRLVDDEDVLIVPGGILQEYDGSSVVESGFLRFPSSDTWSLASSNGVGALTSSKQYFYIVIPEALNARGQRALGTHGGSKAITTAAGEDTVTVTIETITATRRQGSTPNLAFGVYRTDDTVPSDDSVFYRVGQIANDPTVATVAFVDTMSDVNAILQEQLYLGTGELDNVVPPSCRVVAKGNGRVAVAGGETQNSIYFSKRRTDGRALEFSDALRVDAPSDGGPITGLAFMNSTLVIFKRGLIYRMHGDGPNNSGQGAFIEPEMLTSDCGCITQHSIVMTPMGIMFQAERGLMLLSQGYQVSYIGAAIENVSPALGTCVDSVLVPDEQHVRFSDGTQCAVFDYAHGFWFTWSVPAEGPSCVYNGSHCIPHSSLKVLQQSESVWQDNGASYNTILSLAWMSSPASRLQNVKVRKVGILGTAEGVSQLSAVLYYDGSDNASFTKNYLDVAAGPLRTVFQPTSKVTNQMRLTIQDIAIDDAFSLFYTTTEGLVLTEVTFDILVKPGLHIR